MIAEIDGAIMVPENKQWARLPFPMPLDAQSFGLFRFETKIGSVSSSSILDVRRKDS